MMSLKKIGLIVGLMALTLTCFAQFSAIHQQRKDIFSKLPITENDIVFVGNSITHGGEWTEIFEDIRIKNRGISGNTAEAVLDRLQPIIDGRPAKLFLLIGVNDLGSGKTVDAVVAGITTIIGRIQSGSSHTKIYVQSILPVNNIYGLFSGHTSKGAQIIEVNRRLAQMASDTGFTFVDIYSAFKNPNDEKMNPIYTNDGLHLLGSGYLQWKKTIESYVKD